MHSSHTVWPHSFIRRGVCSPSSNTSKQIGQSLENGEKTLVLAAAAAGERVLYSSSSNPASALIRGDYPRVNYKDYFRNSHAAGGILISDGAIIHLEAGDRRSCLLPLQLFGRLSRLR